MTEVMQAYARIERDFNWLLNEIKKPDAWRILEENGRRLEELSFKLRSSGSVGYNTAAIKEEMASLTEEYKMALDSAKVVFLLSELFEEARGTLNEYKAESRDNGWYAL